MIASWTRPVDARWGLPIAALAALLLLAALAPGLARAAEASGTVTIKPQPGKATSDLFKQGAKLSSSTKGKAVTLEVTDLVAGKTTVVKTKGNLVVAKGRRKAVLRRVVVKLRANSTAISAKLGKRNVVVFRATGKPSATATSAALKKADLALTKKGALRLGAKLGLDSLKAGKLGLLNVAAAQKQAAKPKQPKDDEPKKEEPTKSNIDPYFAQCQVAATGQRQGDLPTADPVPTLGLASTGPDSFAWGFRTSFRNYLIAPGPGGGGGSLHALDGASRDGGGPAAGFVFPVSEGSYANLGTPTLSDDQAIIVGGGTAVLCGTAHNFRILIKNPTVVIDSGNSRLIADVDTNLSGIWTPSQRIVLAELVPGEVTQEPLTAGRSEITWESIEATLTETGAEAICGIGADAACNYTEGTALDPLTVAVQVDSEIEPATFTANCDVDVTSKTSGGIAPAAALPSPEDSLALSPGPNEIDWGFKEAFRVYVDGFNPATGLQALNGASRAAGGGPTRGFVFPVASGLYAINDGMDTSDDQAVIEGTGTALFCNPTHLFWVALSNPTIVIDGDNSRIDADLTMNQFNEWTTPTRVTVADLNLDGITPFYNFSGSQVTWGEIPATLNASLDNKIGGYAAGTQLDPVTVAINTPYPAVFTDDEDTTALAEYVEENLPFPLPDPTQGGCEVGVPAGGSTGAARTIDEYHWYWTGTPTSPQSAWGPNAARPAAQPNLSAKQAVGGGALKWGFRTGLRNSLNSTGDYNLANGATASADYFGNGGSLAARPSQLGADAFFTWPAVAGGRYDAGGAGSDDDRLVLKTQGRVAFCQVQSAQRYATIFSNPTVVIDGANSRITVDVLSRYRLSWVRGVVDLAAIDLSGATFSSDTVSGVTTVTWADAPVTLTAEGAKVVGMLSPSTYIDGAALDPATITASYMNS